ncbi:hypothetical protein FKW77_005709 [Venturia effusa]|uniref:Glycosyl transferase CAP10 domain-containing protein n=1 Tax=Venturia effusa TaxID=50376 RepID=A0A517L5E0_9PEZI|nr:hypothetical protein FKW77_005709 [Venturia effusa]
MKPWMASGRRRAIILLTGCSIPLLFVALTTHFFYPNYLDNAFPPPRQVQSLSKEPSSTSAYRSWKPKHTPSTSHTTAQTPIQTSEAFPEEWVFDTKRDERHYGLSEAQCDAAFPNLYKEIDRAVAFRKEYDLGEVKEEDVDIEWRTDGEIIRVMLYDKQLYVIDSKWAGHGYDIPRALALLYSIHRAVVAFPGPLPNIEFSMGLGDWPGDSAGQWPLWVLTRRTSDEEKWVMPDFGYWSWPLDVVGDYTQVRKDIRENEKKWQKKVPKAVWRGASATNGLRQSLLNESEGRTWSDVKEIVWQNQTTLAPGMAQLSLTMPEHCKYQYVIHTEGHSYSGRGKYLLNCASVSIVHTPEWIEPHTHLFIAEGEYQNVVAVERDFSDLDHKMNYLLSHDSLAQEIARNSVAQFRDRYLTPAAQACYWRKLFHGWASVSFEPELYKNVVDSHGNTKRKSRGTPFETYVSSLRLPDDEY